MDSDPMPEETVIVGLSFTLACKYLEATTGKASRYWSTKFGNEAMSLLHDDNISPDQLEELCAEVLNFGQKL